MEVESSGRRNDQPRPLARWRTSGVLINIDEKNTGRDEVITWTVLLVTRTDVGYVVPSGDEPILELVSENFILHKK